VGDDYRIARVEQLIKKEVAEILDTRVTDPTLAGVCVLWARVSRDLSYADVFVGFAGDDEQVEAVLAALAKCRNYVQTLVGAKVRLRKTPKVRFRLDKQYRSALRVFDTLKELEAGREFSDEEDREGP
jgi:ribosome-binding factor A